NKPRIVALARLVLLRKIRAVLALAGKKRKGVFYAPQKLLLRKTFVVRDQKSLLGRVCLNTLRAGLISQKVFFFKNVFGSPIFFAVLTLHGFLFVSVRQLPAIF
ncbi:MAG: hypothetical protein IKS15_03890, partial [Opitutales bacterium]|nr:hypothetical protein [Opitutales bacterium]